MASTVFAHGGTDERFPAGSADPLALVTDGGAAMDVDEVPAVCVCCMCV